MRFTTKFAAIVLAICPCQYAVVASQADIPKHPRKLERVVAFAVQEEIRTNHLEHRHDVCLGIGNGLAVDAQAIIAELKREHIYLHSNEWCNLGPRGLRIGIAAPIRESPPGTYQLVVELGDLRPIQHGEHFATLVRRGEYTVKVVGTSKPELISYKRTCCSRETKD